MTLRALAIALVVTVGISAMSLSATAARPRKFTSAQVAQFEADIHTLLPTVPKSTLAVFVPVGKDICNLLDEGTSENNVWRATYSEVSGRTNTQGRRQPLQLAP